MMARGVRAVCGGALALAAVNCQPVETAGGQGDTTAIFDTRAGGAHDLQACNDLSCAQAKMSTYGGVQFTTNFDGRGTRAFVFPWVKYNGRTTCTGNVGSEQGMLIWTGIAGGSGERYVQWKSWWGRTATGGGTGVVGSFNHLNTVDGYGHKFMLWNRSSAGGSVPGHLTMLTRTLQVESYPGSIDVGGGGTLSQPFTPGYTPNDHLNEVVTLTIRIKPESSPGVHDGELQMWLNATELFNLSSAYTAPYRWADVQLGGPTWICPPQDQTSYIWDVVVWRRG